MSSERSRVLEVKRHLDGRESSFECELVEQGTDRVVVRFHVEEPERFLGADVAGIGPLDTYGLFWRRRPYNCYYFVPSDAPLGAAPALVRFDVVRDVEFIERSDDLAEVRYLDLVLDLVVTRAGTRWEDEDEVESAARAGLLSASDLARIAQARRTLDTRYRLVIAEVRRTLAGLREG